MTLSVTLRRAIATALFGAIAIVAFKVLVTPGLDPEKYLTAALALATAVSGWFVVETVLEMRETREAAYRPVLIPFARVTDHDQNTGVLGVKNAGLGPAMEVNVAMRYGEDYGSYVFTLETTLLAAGEERPIRVGSIQFDKKFHPDLWEGRTFRLKGTCKDVRGAVHRVSSSVKANEGWSAEADRSKPVDEHGRPLPPLREPTDLKDTDGAED